LKRSFILGTTLAWLVLAGAARADLVPWSYNWTPNTLAIQSDSPGTSKLTLTNEPAGSATGSSDIVATNIKVVSTAKPDSPDHFTHQAYRLTLTLTDNASKATGNLVFTGTFDGTVSGQSSHVMNTFTGQTTQSIVLGGNTYTITIGPYTPPGPPSSANAGSISATAKVSTTGSSSGSPEPSSMLLAGLGVSLLGGASWWKRRKKVALRCA
jgi:hypothetical protein